MGNTLSFNLLQSPKGSTPYCDVVRVKPRYLFWSSRFAYAVGNCTVNSEYARALGIGLRSESFLSCYWDFGVSTLNESQPLFFAARSSPAARCVARNHHGVERNATADHSSNEDHSSKGDCSMNLTHITCSHPTVRVNGKQEEEPTTSGQTGAT